MGLQSDKENEVLYETIRPILEESYDLGMLTRVKRLLGGYCNKSYAVWMSTDRQPQRYFLRLYNPSVVENEILFEHALLIHLRANGFNLAAAIIPSRNHATVVSTPPLDAHQGTKAFWALFEFLEGEDKYSWTHTDLTDREFASAAEIFALFHHCGDGFQKPLGADRAQPRILDYLPTFNDTLAAFREQAQDRRCDRIFKDHYQSILKTLDVAAGFGVRYEGMPVIPIHCDYHPGNLKFSDEKAVGIFDFDWSKIDYRLFDVALGLIYFTSIWNGPAAGLRPDKYSLFLNTYNQTCHRSDRIRPLNKQERRYLVPMLSIANLYVLHWALVNFYDQPAPDDVEHSVFIDHHIGLMHWIAANQDELQLWTANALS